MNKFEYFLMDKMCETWHGPKDMAEDAFDSWIEKLSIDDWLKYAQEYKDEHICKSCGKPFSNGDCIKENRPCTN